VLTEHIRNSHEITKFSKQIQDQWAQLRSNSPSARAERERAVLAFANTSPKTNKHSTSGPYNTSLSQSDGVLVDGERNTEDKNNQNHTPEVSDLSDGDDLDHSNQDQVVENINQDGQNAEYSSAIHPSPKYATDYRIRQAQLTEGAGRKEFITAHTHLWQKHSSILTVKKICKLKALAHKKHAEEKKPQKKLARKKVQRCLFREIIIQEKKAQNDDLEELTEAEFAEEKVVHDLT